MLDWGCIRPEELPEILRLLDREYMARRERTGTVRDHYPDLLDLDNRENLLILREEGRPVSFCAVQAVRLHLNGRLLRGGMIGFVLTRSESRGRGHARALLAHAASKIQSQQGQFAVLFSTLHDFYAKQGWILRDSGLVGTRAATAGSKASGGVDSFLDPVNPEALARLETIRQREESLWAERAKDHYRRRPLSVDRLGIMLSARQEAYCLLGVRENRIFIYEISGKTDGLDEIWNRLRDLPYTITINSHQGCSAYGWLLAHDRLVFSPQRQALWKWFEPAGAASTIALNHLPYFDRI